MGNSILTELNHFFYSFLFRSHIYCNTTPAITYTESDKRRREIVLATYQNALKAGDENVYFIDGEVFYGEHDRELCTVDKIHPNDLGFYRMAQVIEPIIKSILDKAAK